MKYFVTFHYKSWWWIGNQWLPTWQTAFWEIIFHYLTDNNEPDEQTLAQNKNQWIYWCRGSKYNPQQLLAHWYLGLATVQSAPHLSLSSWKWQHIWLLAQCWLHKAVHLGIRSWTHFTLAHIWFLNTTVNMILGKSIMSQWSVILS